MHFAEIYKDAFLRATGQHLGPGHALEVHLIEAAEQRLELDFPRALREFYQVAGRIEVPPDYGDWLFSMDSLEVVSGYFAFINDYIAEPFYGICLDHFGLDNPPVYRVCPKFTDEHEFLVSSQAIESKGDVCEFLCDKIKKWSLYAPYAPL